MKNHFIINKQYEPKDKIKKKNIKIKHKKTNFNNEGLNYFDDYTDTPLIEKEDIQTHHLFKFPTLDKCFDNLNNEELEKISKLIFNKLKGSKVLLSYDLFFNAYKEVKGLPVLTNDLINDIYESHKEDITDILFSDELSELRKYFSEEYENLLNNIKTINKDVATLFPESYLYFFEKETIYFAVKKTTDLLNIDSDILTEENKQSYVNFINLIAHYGDLIKEEDPKTAELIIDIYEKMSSIL